MICSLLPDSGGCGGGHGHSHGAPAAKAEEDFGLQFGLYQKIDMEAMECLNEAVENSGKTVFKPHDQRKDREKFVISDADEELLFNVPFTGSVKLKGLVVVGGEDGTGPDKMRLFKNRPHMTFDDASSAKPDQEFDVVRDDDGMVQYATKVVQFSSVSHLTIHFPSNRGGGEETKVYYIGLKGDFMRAQRTGVVNAVYESRPMMEDHKQDLKDLGMSSNNPGF